MTREQKLLLKEHQREISACQRLTKGKRPPHGEVVCDTRGYAIRTKWPSNFNRADRELQRLFNAMRDAKRAVSELTRGER